MLEGAPHLAQYWKSDTTSDTMNVQHRLGMIGCARLVAQEACPEEPQLLDFDVLATIVSHGH